MKILLLGGSGQVGWELRRALAPIGEVLTPRRADGADLQELSPLRALVDQMSPDVIVNAAAFTAVDDAETSPVPAWQVNAFAPEALAALAHARNIWLVHYSTDYVFDGAKALPYAEDDVANPVNVYGMSKLAGDQAILASRCKCLIFRTSWVFGARGGNFVKTILGLAREREALRVVNDQFGAPTGADLLADVTAHALRTALASGDASLSGLYNLTASGETHWDEYARVVLEEAEGCGLALKARASAIVGIPSCEYVRPARRPANSRLSTVKLRNTFDLRLPPWDEGVRRVVKEIVG